MLKHNYQPGGLRAPFFYGEAMGNTDNILKTLVSAVKQPDRQKPAPYDTPAEVRRVEDGIAWVHIPGGVDETPVKLTIAARPGDTVQIRVGGGSAWLTGNSTAPPTDDRAAEAADKKAVQAQETAEQAVDDAGRAKEAADSAEKSAESAQTSADNANQYASRALGGLSTVQSVVETLNWITEHGTMTLTTDTALDPTHVYFVVDPSGEYVVGSTHYSIVSEPDAADLSTYYVLSIDESLQNYVGTHLALTGEGLWLLPETGGYKVLIATGSGTTYTTAGTYIIDAVGNIVARFGETTQIGENGKTRVEVDYHSLKLIDLDNETYFHLSDLRDADGYLAIEESFTADGNSRFFSLSYTAASTDYTVTVSDSSGGSVTKAVRNVGFATAPTEGATITVAYYTTSYDAKAITFGTRISGTVGGMSMAMGIANKATSARAIAIGMRNSATGQGSVAIGSDCKATGNEAFAIGYETEATHYAVAQNQGTKASSLYQTAMGRYNIEDRAGKYVLIIGNGTSDSARSNAYAVTPSGDEHLALNTSAASGTIDGDLYAAITALGWGSEVIV